MSARKIVPMLVFVKHGTNETTLSRIHEDMCVMEYVYIYKIMYIAGRFRDTHKQSSFKKTISKQMFISGISTTLWTVDIRNTWL